MTTMEKLIRLEVPKEIKDKNLQKAYIAAVQAVVRESAVLRLYEERKISTATGAKILGLPLYDFMQLLGKHQLSVFNYPAEELAGDVAAASAAVETKPDKLRNIRQKKLKADLKRAVDQTDRDKFTTYNSPNEILKHVKAEGRKRLTAKRKSRR